MQPLGRPSGASTKSRGESSREFQRTEDPTYISIEELEFIATNTSHRFQTSRVFDQVSVMRPAVIPKCALSHHLYDPASDTCVETCTQGHCKGGLTFDLSSDGKYGACTCTYSECILPPSARPLVLHREYGRCYQMATQGPCKAGEVLVPVDRETAECGPNACTRNGPKYAKNFSKLSQNSGRYDSPFLFTYNNECYMTETEAFCDAGKVARFMVPYKIPFCVPRDFTRAAAVGPAVAIVKVECGSGFVEDPARKLCVPAVDID